MAFTVCAVGIHVHHGTEPDVGYLWCFGGSLVPLYHGHCAQSVREELDGVPQIPLSDI